MAITSAPQPAPVRPQRPDRRWRFFRSVSALILREMSTTYGRSPGGYLWAVLEPIGAIALMSFVFSLVLRSPGLGNNFALFYATGYLVFQLYMSISSLIAAAIRYSRAFLAYPSVTFMDALVARFLLNTMTDLLVMVIVLSGIIWFYDLNLILYWPAIFNAIGMALALAVGVGTMNCFLFTRFPLWERVWRILNRPMFLLSGVIFLPETLPSEFRHWMMMNPVAHAPSEMRRGFYATYDAVHVVPAYPYLVALVLTIFGLLFLLRYHKDIVLR